MLYGTHGCKVIIEPHVWWLFHDAGYHLNNMSLLFLTELEH